MPLIFLDLFLLILIGFILVAAYMYIRRQVQESNKYKEVAERLDELKIRKEVGKEIEEVQRLIEEIKKEKSGHPTIGKIKEEVKELLDDEFSDKSGI